MELVRSLLLLDKMLSPHSICRAGNVIGFLRTLGAVTLIWAAISFPAITVAQESYTASEFIEEDIQNQMSSADIVALLNQTVGGVTAANRAVGLPLRQGLFVTAIPRGSNIILRFEVDQSSTNQPTPVQTIYNWYRDGALYVNRKYQRKLVWTLIDNWT
jgi:hypothetical protein